MATADWYRRIADECASSAKMAIMNQERARLSALSERYMRLAMDELKSTGESERTNTGSKLVG